MCYSTVVANKVIYNAKMVCYAQHLRTRCEHARCPNHGSVVVNSRWQRSGQVYIESANKYPRNNTLVHNKRLRGLILLLWLGMDCNFKVQIIRRNKHYIAMGVCILCKQRNTPKHYIASAMGVCIDVCCKQRTTPREPHLKGRHGYHCYHCRNKSH